MIDVDWQIAAVSHRRNSRSASLLVSTIRTLTEHNIDSVNSSNAPAAAQAYRSPPVRAYMAVGILILLGIAAVATILSTKAEIDLVQRAVAGETITEAEALANDSRQQLVSMIFLGVYAASAVAFIAWMYMASRNLAPLNGYDRRYQKYPPSHTIFWWFIPVAPLWQPYRVMKNLWNETHGLAEDASPRLLMVWWLFWLVFNALRWVTAWALFDPSYTNIESLINAGYRTIASQLFLIAAGVLAGVIVLKVTRTQDRRNWERIAGTSA